MSEYRIGEFAKKLCVSQDLLKHYEKYEILSSTKKGPGGYRYYDFRQSPRILFSRQLQNWGFSLKEISRIIKGISCAETYDMLSGRLKVLKEDHGVLFWHIRYLESLCSLLERVESGNFHGQWFVQNTEPCLFIPHTNGYDFLTDDKSYKTLHRWITLQGITKQAALIKGINSDRPALT
ncbi:MAG: MerR family transcriptional regulator, partial [Spirochaetales bacterium]|nr:MerR family transcriptional regulator [Spirochaetales bacterium]